jgi:hypothetical protein
MKQRRRIYYPVAQRSEIWDRWQAGEPATQSGHIALSKAVSLAHTWSSQGHGGALGFAFAPPNCLTALPIIDF